MEKEEPSLITQAGTLTKAIIQWAKDDFKKVPPEVYQQRLAKCQTCSFWKQDGFGGLGKCRLCGCSASKLYLPGARCPQNPPLWELARSPSELLDNYGISSTPQDSSGSNSL